MQYQIHQPNHYLANFIQYYWCLEQNSQTVQVARVIPSGESQMIFHYGTPFREIRGRHKSVLQPQSVVCGQQTTYSDIAFSGSTGMVAAVLYPHALSVFFPNPINEFTNQVTALDTFFRQAISDLQERMIAANGLRERIVLIEEFLLARLSVPNNFALMQEATRVIKQTNGQIIVSGLAKKLNISKRQFERVFLANVGIPPKKFGCIVRLNAAITLATDVESLTALTYEAGYFDQSHLIRDFQPFTGLLPSEFLRYPCYG